MKETKKNILLLSLFCVILVIIRIIRTEQFSFIFMFWNLFLAFIPLGISNYLTNSEKTISNLKLTTLTIIWLLFLPNAPYMVTDLFHLHKREYLPIWFDLILILMFAITGLYLFYISLNQAIILTKNKFPNLYKPQFLIFLFLIVSYGVYIGRFLRLNSWDIIDPIGLIKTCLSTILYLPRLKDMCCFTVVYSIFLGFIFLIIKPVLKPIK
jgi:uncharacterized membrane protein